MKMLRPLLLLHRMSPSICLLPSYYRNLEDIHLFKLAQGYANSGFCGSSRKGWIFSRNMHIDSYMKTPLGDGILDELTYTHAFDHTGCVHERHDESDDSIDGECSGDDEEISSLTKHENRADSDGFPKPDFCNVNTRSDFCEEIRISDDAGLPLMPRSMLDFEVEDAIVAEFSDSGRSLWRRFKESSTKPGQFRCKDVIKSWILEGNVASRAVLTYIILVFRSWNKNKRALEILDWVMEEKPYEFLEMDHAIQVDLIGKINGVTSASKYYTQIPPAFQTTMIYSVLLAAYLERNMERKAQRLLSIAVKMGLSNQVFLYNQMLHFYKGKGKISVVANLLKAMDMHAVKADLYTYNMILDLTARKGDVVGMRNVWKLLEKEENLKPNSASYAILARGYINADLRGKAETAIKLVESSPYKSRKVVYRWLLKLHAQMGREDELKRIWELLTSSFEVLVDDYTIMIESLGKAGEIERAEEMFKEVVNTLGIKRLHQYNALLSIYLHNGILKKAESLVKKMLEYSFSPGPSTYHQLIKMYIGGDDAEKAMATFKEAQQAGRTLSSRKPWYATYLLMLEMFGNKGDIDNAETIMKDLRDAGYPRGYQMYCALVKAYVKANVTPSGFLDRMRADGAIPNSHIRSELSKINKTIDVF